MSLVERLSSQLHPKPCSYYILRVGILFIYKKNSFDSYPVCVLRACDKTCKIERSIFDIFYFFIMKRIYKNAFKQEKLRKQICEQGASTVLPVSKLIFKISFRRFGPVKVENEIKKPIGANRRRLNLSNCSRSYETRLDHEKNEIYNSSNSL